MSSTNGLNVGAANFTPGVGLSPPAPATYEEDLFEEYECDEEEEVLDALEAEMHNAEMDALAAEINGATISPPGAPSSTLSSHLAGHASEFWFPDCRNCDCCKGYKHGCSCGNVCKCSLETDAKPALPLAPTKPSAVKAASGTQNKPPCRFYLSPGGCRFGEKCRFSHS